MSVPALDARGLVRRFGEVVAVDHADIAVPAGALVALLGPSGCGKTTALRLIAGLDSGEGTIDIAGRRVTGAGRAVPPEGRGVGLVFQDSVLFPHLSVADNVRYGLRGRGRDAEAARMLDMLGIGHVARRLPSEISGGEQQRTALARTLAARPALVLLDEPFAHLDASLRERVREETLQVLERAGTAALIVTHDQSEALAVAERIIVMNDGRIHQAGTAREVYQRPADAFTAAFVGRGTLVPAAPAGRGMMSTALGAVRVDAATPVQERLAVVRPESVQLVGPDDGLAGRVIRRTYRGSDELVRVELRDGAVVEVADASPPEVGARVYVAVRGELATVPVPSPRS